MPENDDIALQELIAATYEHARSVAYKVPQDDKERKDADKAEGAEEVVELAENE